MTTKRQARREAKCLFRLCFVNGRLDETRVRRVAQSLAEAGRRGARPMLQHFIRLVRLEQARHTANIESATALTPDLRSEIEANLTRRYGWGLKVAYAERPELIGGVRIQVGSDLFDSSVRTALATLASSF
jgi:F-type H+-transporting ATPase subunit delta